MLTDQQKTDARRYMGYPMYGDEPTQMFGYRFMTHYGTMEYRMLHLSAAEEAVVVQHIGDCAAAEAAVMSSSDNLDTNRAAVWEHNPLELSQRQQLYRWKRLELCRFFGIPAGPGLGCVGGIVI